MRQIPHGKRRVTSEGSWTLRERSLVEMGKPSSPPVEAGQMTGFKDGWMRAEKRVADTSLSFSPIPRPERFLMALFRVDPDRRTTAAGCELIVKSGRNCLDGGAPDVRHRGAAFIGAPGAKLVSGFLRC